MLSARPLNITQRPFQAFYQFDDEAALDRAMDEEVPRLIDMFVRDWPDVPRIRETFVLAQEFGA
jgi:hypothetical protein